MPPENNQSDSDSVDTRAGGAEENTVQVKAAGIVALLVLVFFLLAVATLTLMAAIGAYGTFPDYSDPDVMAAMVSGAEMEEPKLHWPWAFFLWICVNGGMVGKLVGGVVAFLGIGIKAIADHNDRIWAAATIMIACLVGLALSLCLMWLLSESDALTTLRSFTEKSDEEFTTIVNITLGVIAAWFGGFAARQVGIEPAKDVWTSLKKSITGQGEDS